MCLSLLGTWNGPGWVPGVSTLYQVLLSIQSLILNQWPRENEPGHEQPRDGSNRSLNEHHCRNVAYNMEVRLATLTHGITAFIRAPPRFFEAAARAHFAFKRRELAAQALLWAEEAVLLARYQLDATLHGGADTHKACKFGARPRKKQTRTLT